MVIGARHLLLVVVLLGAAEPARAQGAPAALRRRMDAFAAALAERAPMERIAGFFPREAEWELVRSPHRPPPTDALLRHRFAPGQTLAAIREGGPVCDSFGGVFGDVGPYEGVLVSQAMAAAGRRWSYVGRGRFVPPDAKPASRIYVQWTLERGAWVVSQIGEEYWYEPRVLGEAAVPHITPDTTAANELPPERRYGSAARWFVEGGLLYLGDHTYVKYGLPRVIDAELLQRFGSVGAVPVFVEPAASRPPEVLYVPTRPGEYQPYNGFGHSICRD